MTVNQFDVIEAAARAEYDGGEDAINVFQFQVQDAGFTSDGLVATDIVEIMEAFYLILKTVVVIATAFRDIKIRNVTQGILMGSFPFVATTLGTDGNNAMPHAVSPLLSFPTNVPRVTLRKYLPNCSVAATDGTGRFTPGATALYASAGAMLLPTLVQTTRSYDFGYLSPKTSTFVKPVSVIATDIPAYQRRRKPGRGS